MYRNTVVFGVTWRAACSLHLPTNECEITGCSWSTFSSDLFEHLCIFFFIFFQHKLRFTSTHKHKHAPSLFHWMTVLCMGQNGSGQTFKHTHKLLLVFSRQWWPWVQSLLLACEQNAKLTPVTHSCVCVCFNLSKNSDSDKHWWIILYPPN